MGGGGEGGGEERRLIDLRGFAAGKNQSYIIFIHDCKNAIHTNKEGLRGDANNNEVCATLTDYKKCYNTCKIAAEPQSIEILHAS